MENFKNIFLKLFMLDKEPQKIGLSQFKELPKTEETKQPSIKNKDIKLSDLMRRETIKNN